MNAAVAHRGPDDAGFSFMEPGLPATRFRDLAPDQTVPAHHVAFGHRRFSIIDPTPAGHQPFWSADGQVGLVFNGEIYNYVELRTELQGLGRSFRTDSDTEVLLEGYRQWGTDCFRRFNGFWALALYDFRRRQVLLARDRIGKAPLYILQHADGLYFSSEIKGLKAAVGSAALTVNEQAILDFVRDGWRDVGHQTFFNEIRTFPNAAFAWVEPDGSFVPTTFWRLEARRRSEGEVSLQEAASGLRKLLADAVRIRLRADVPVGFELSGGMDSSALVALAAEQHTGPLRIYTVSFPGTPYDEEPYARKVVDSLGRPVEYVVLTPPPDEFFEHADWFVWLQEEPFHSPNLVTNVQVLRRMRAEGVRVSINGAAGDEVLAGYAADYFLPYLRHLVAQGRWGRAVREYLLLSESGQRPRPFGTLRRLLTFPAALRAPGRKPAGSKLAGHDPFRDPPHARRRFGPPDDLEGLLHGLMGSWRMNYWLRSGNQAIMGVPLEVRGPFLDYRVVDYVFQLPVGYLIRDGWLKRVLREAVKDVLPEEVVWRRKKMGFPFPLKDWLGQHRDRFMAELDGLTCPYLDVPALRRDYETIRKVEPKYLWRLLSLALWWRRCVEGRPLACAQSPARADGLKTAG
jgi:asparagine synthase (glutamine-hydrolysing)